MIERAAQKRPSAKQDSPYRLNRWIQHRFRHRSQFLDTNRWKKCFSSWRGRKSLGPKGQLSTRKQQIATSNVTNRLRSLVCRPRNAPGVLLCRGRTKNHHFKWQFRACTLHHAVYVEIYREAYTYTGARAHVSTTCVLYPVDPRPDARCTSAMAICRWRGLGTGYSLNIESTADKTRIDCRRINGRSESNLA